MFVLFRVGKDGAGWAEGRSTVSVRGVSRRVALFVGGSSYFTIIVLESLPSVE